MPAMSDTPRAPHVPESPDAALPDRTTRTTRAVAVASLLALIVLGLAWELWLAPTGQRSWALKVLPLTVPLVGFLKYRMRTYRWVSLLVWLYFTEGVVRATSERGTGAVLAAVQVLLCVLLFAACAWHVRWRLARGRQAAGA